MQKFFNGEITSVAAGVIFLVDKQAILKMEVNMFCLSNCMVPEVSVCFQLDVTLFKKPLNWLTNEGKVKAN